MNRLAACFAALALAGAFAAHASATAETVVYSFCSRQSCADGAAPYAALVDIKSTLYGTTYLGGDYNYGTVFSLDLASGAETVGYSFAARGHRDGMLPVAGLLRTKANLYGTTFDGGRYCNGKEPGCGTVFTFNTKRGVEKVLHSFAPTDGQFPASGLVEMDKELYGTTSLGGTDSGGAVFAVDPKTGAETVLHWFLDDGVDGFHPLASFVNVNGILYGTTFYGGSYGGGTVFSIDPSTGAEEVVHSFDQAVNDGALPQADLIEVNGLLYGTTSAGGNRGCTNGCGTVYSIDPSSGTESVVYAFNAGSDGSIPVAALVDVNGILYGTTESGGNDRCAGDHGCGTVFSIEPGTGTETVLYVFCGRHECTDGATPLAGLIPVGGLLYGTTSSGGTAGRGVIFSIRPGAGTSPTRNAPNSRPVRLLRSEAYARRGR